MGLTKLRVESENIGSDGDKWRDWSLEREMQRGLEHGEKKAAWRSVLQCTVVYCAVQIAAIMSRIFH